MENENKSHLTLVDDSYTTALETAEFVPLPFYAWEQRPDDLPLDREEVRTALALSHGDAAGAAYRLKVTLVRMNRYIRANPYLKPLLDELREVVLTRAASIPIQTLFDPAADARRLEWASTKILQSRLAQGHDLSPAPAGGANASVTLQSENRKVTFRWRTEEDAIASSENSSEPEIDVD